MLCRCGTEAFKSSSSINLQTNKSMPPFSSPPIDNEDSSSSINSGFLRQSPRQSPRLSPKRPSLNGSPHSRRRLTDLKLTNQKAPTLYSPSYIKEKLGFEKEKPRQMQKRPSLTKSSNKQQSSRQLGLEKEKPRQMQKRPSLTKSSKQQSSRQLNKQQSSRPLNKQQGSRQLNKEQSLKQINGKQQRPSNQLKKSSSLSELKKSKSAPQLKRSDSAKKLSNDLKSRKERLLGIKSNNNSNSVRGKKLGAKQSPGSGKLRQHTKTKGGSSVEPIQKKVCFGSVEVREYSRCMGDNPSCTPDGPAISLDWAYEARGKKSLNAYEKSREGKLRGDDDILLLGHEREEILKQFCYYTDEEIEENIRELEKAARQLELSNMTKSLDSFHLVFERSQRKVFKVGKGVIKSGNKVGNVVIEGGTRVGMEVLKTPGNILEVGKGVVMGGAQVGMGVVKGGAQVGMGVVKGGAQVGMGVVKGGAQIGMEVINTPRNFIKSFT